MREPCPFCLIVAGKAEAEIIHRWQDAIAIRPLNPVVDGHLIVISNSHVENALSYPFVTASTMQRAVELASIYGCDLNIITSVGAAATQTIKHLHIHIVPRFENDGLSLPWTGQAAKEVSVDRTEDSEGACEHDGHEGLNYCELCGEHDSVDCALCNESYDSVWNRDEYDAAIAEKGQRDA